MKISVIVPAYNCQSTIKRCIDSILNQTGAEIEVVCVNDGSRDNTREILEGYSDRIVLINIENGGVANARNVALSAASGDYIMFCDSDDEVLPGCIEMVSKKLQQTDADIIRFEYLISKNNERSKPLHYAKEEAFIEKKDFPKKVYPEFIKGIFLNSLWNHCFRKELLEGLSFPKDMKTAEDAFFCLNVYSRAKTVLFLTEEYYLYVQSDGSLTAKGLAVREKYRCNFMLSKEILRHLPDWGMNTLYWRTRTRLRPFFLTIDKIRRILK